MKRGHKVERPTKKSEYTIEFGSAGAARGWRDLCATIRNPLADVWDFLTKTPHASSPTCYPLKDELETVVHDGIEYQRWQVKPTRQGDARIWYFVRGQVVVLERVYTHHPNETK
ncbi:MAG TPA: hypothetical protein VG502_01845 [Flexivirga sp.]|uniref:hypothetical protein n=1 Tax=Flexivirga sp. TaxID=1962927 RepID=UPI002CD2B7EC|nr:hypothetical protein [Flexivirga sp.]HWC21018.1 hypothetical protein [Flexivirga sp.]